MEIKIVKVDPSQINKTDKKNIEAGYIELAKLWKKCEQAVIKDKIDDKKSG